MDLWYSFERSKTWFLLSNTNIIARKLPVFEFLCRLLIERLSFPVSYFRRYIYLGVMLVYLHRYFETNWFSENLSVNEQGQSTRNWDCRHCLNSARESEKKMKKILAIILFFFHTGINVESISSRYQAFWTRVWPTFAEL